MSGEEKLYRAIGEIDDTIIEEAMRPARSVGFAKKVGGAALAASLAIVTVAVIIGSTGLFMPKADKDFAENGDGYYDDVNNAVNDSQGELEQNGDAETTNGIYGMAGYIVNVIRTDGKTFEFTLVVNAPEHLTGITLIGYETVGGEEITHIYTTGDTDEEGVVVYHEPTVTVNGEAADALPSEAGSYRITVTFEGINDAESVEWRNYFTVGGIGNVLR